MNGVDELVFQEFPKIARLNRECIISEKIDGTNACVVVSDDGTKIGAQTRNTLLGPGESDSFGFALWVYQNAERLKSTLGPGHHFGEWWGKGIQRGYNRPHKRLSLFNVERWKDLPITEDLGIVPVLARGMFSTALVEDALQRLRTEGSLAAPGFLKPEGVVIWHVAANMGFKVTLERDNEWKGKRDG